jgi:hypothetical protein
MDMPRFNVTSAVVLLAGLLLSSPVMAQSKTTYVVAGPTAIQENPRGDGVTLGVVAPGTVVEVLDQYETWYLVSAPASHAGEVSMQRGWISVESLQMPNGRMPGARNGQFLVRGFGQAGGTLFAASDSFDAIVGDGLNSVFGGGGQLVFPSGLFAQASLDRFQKTGTRALVSGSQVFTLEIPNRLTITSVLATAGFRSESAKRIATYFGGGAGWYTLDETSPTEPGSAPLNKRSVGYHVLGGVEFPFLSWAWIGGEVQWATVPKALGDTGVSAIYGETDMGGTTFRLKVTLGY